MRDTLTIASYVPNPMNCVTHDGSLFFYVVTLYQLGGAYNIGCCLGYERNSIQRGWAHSYPSPNNLAPAHVTGPNSNNIAFYQLGFSKLLKSGNILPIMAGIGILHYDIRLPRHLSGVWRETDIRAPREQTSLKRIADKPPEFLRGLARVALVLRRALRFSYICDTPFTWEDGGMRRRLSVAGRNGARIHLRHIGVFKTTVNFRAEGKSGQRGYVPATWVRFIPGFPRRPSGYPAKQMRA